MSVAGRLLLFLLLVAANAPLAAAAAPAPATPMRPEAKARYDEAMALYAAHEYRAAARALAAAHALDPRPEILFAQAQATRLAGDCPAALVLYQRFLDTDPPTQQVAATRIAVARCTTAASPPAAPVVVAPPPPPPQPPRWYRDRKGAVLLGAGLLGAGVGAALLASAHDADDDARAERGRYDVAASLRDKAERRWTWGMGAVVVGSALVATGIGRYVWVMVRADGGGAVGARGRF